MSGLKHYVMDHIGDIPRLVELDEVDDTLKNITDMDMVSLDVYESTYPNEIREISMSNGVIYVHTWDGELLYSNLPSDVCKWKNHREYLLSKRLLERLNCPQDKPVYENPHGSR